MLNSRLGDWRRIVQFWHPIRSVQSAHSNNWIGALPSRFQVLGIWVLPTKYASMYAFLFLFFFFYIFFQQYLSLIDKVDCFSLASLGVG